MQQHSEDFYLGAIKSIFPYSWNIRKPDVMGRVGKVFFVDTEDGTQVCKFNDKNIITRNNHISHLLQLNNAPVPYTQMHAFLDVFLEVYPYCSGTTLFEHMKNGATNAQVFNTYKQAMEIQRDISRIKPTELQFGWGKYVHQTFAQNKCAVTHPIIAHMLGIVYAAFARCGRQYLLHNDIQPKNILVDDKLNVTHLVDLDSVALSNENFAVLHTLYSYPLTNHAEYIEAYEDIVNRNLKRQEILYYLKLLHRLRDWIRSTKRLVHR